MTVTRTVVLTACLLTACTARAQDAQPLPPAVADVVYKGIVGKALDAVPMDPEKRVVLQRTNAVVSSTLTGRSLTLWVGLANPVLLVAGAVWGIYSAANIKAPAASAKPDMKRFEPVEPAQIEFALLVAPPVKVDVEAVPCLPCVASPDPFAAAKVHSYDTASTVERVAVSPWEGYLASTRF